MTDYSTENIDEEIVLVLKNLSEMAGDLDSLGCLRWSDKSIKLIMLYLKRIVKEVESLGWKGYGELILVVNTIIAMLENSNDDILYKICVSITNFKDAIEKEETI